MKAFSLIEVMVVVAIAGIMSALAIPNFNSAMERQDELTKSAEVERFILSARNDARIYNRCVQVTVSAAQIAKARYETCGNIADAYRLGATPTLGGTVTNADLALENLQGQANTVVFLPNGALADTNSALLAFKGKQLETVQFEIWPASGAVYVKE